MPLHGLTIAFDLDGTLVDTAPDLIGSLNVVLEGCGLAPLPLASARWLVGRGARALIERGFDAAGEPLDPERIEILLDRFLAVYRSRIAEESRPFDGLGAALDRLAADGATLCVCTNKPTDLSNLLLNALDLRERFASVVGADAAPKQKPDPRHLEKAVKDAGGVLSRAVMVGDSETDVATARNAAVPVILVPFGYTERPAADLGADVLIEHYCDLRGAVDAVLPALNPA